MVRSRFDNPPHAPQCTTNDHKRPQVTRSAPWSHNRSPRTHHNTDPPIQNQTCQHSNDNQPTKREPTNGRKAHKIMIGGNSSKLEFIVEKSLLDLVEKQNKLYTEITTKTICDQHQSIFGEPGSNLRRDIQEHWNNLRRRKVTIIIARGALFCQLIPVLAVADMILSVL